MADEQLRNVPEGDIDERSLRKIPTKPKVTRSRKCCVTELWAVVETNGTLVRGRNVVKANKVNPSAPGIYEVFFNQTIQDGVFVATLGRPGIFSEPPGEITVALRAGSGNKGVWITTHNSQGAFKDHGFHLLVLKD